LLFLDLARLFCLRDAHRTQKGYRKSPGISIRMMTDVEIRGKS
jgi:hypothetical protein